MQNIDKLEFRGATPEILQTSKILIVEDDRVQRMMLRQMYENLGFVRIYEAEDGQKGWEKTLEIDPDLVLLDINMPIMDGFAYCEKARNHQDYKDTTILVQTGLTDLQEKERIFSSGATDYVTKPVDFHEIASRSFIHLERGLHIKELEAFNVRVSNELKSAKQLLEMMLPNLEDIASLKEKYQIDLSSEFKSSQEMGGDFWGFETINDHRLAVYCLDFSGHGLDSALNAVRVHTILSNPNIA